LLYSIHTALGTQIYPPAYGQVLIVSPISGHVSRFGHGFGWTIASGSFQLCLFLFCFF